jgi:hypothetical protein
MRLASSATSHLEYHHHISPRDDLSTMLKIPEDLTSIIRSTLNDDLGQSERNGRIF